MVDRYIKLETIERFYVPIELLNKKKHTQRRK